jgi:3-deoxy-7-phosphoheptulonate synthase
MNAKHATDDVRIRAIKELSPPSHLVREFPLREPAAELVYETRQAIHRILHGMDDRLLVVVGPCSIHDPKAAIEYARGWRAQRDRLKDRLEIVMRVYFEKPRTTVGWKGLINDPGLDGSFDINRGLRLARELLLDINELGLPAGTEFLDMITPQYVADLISWGAIGARTTESQVHRELASGLSCPVGFKNGTDGNVRIALDAIKAASQPHHFLSVTKGGHSAIVSTNGNEDCHVILRGGKAPNFDRASVEAACREAGGAALAVPADDRREPRQQPEEAREPDRGRARHRRPAPTASRGAYLRRDGREPPRRRPAGPGRRSAARLRPEHHRRLHRLGGHDRGARHARRGRRRAARRARELTPGLVRRHPVTRRTGSVGHGRRPSDDGARAVGRRPRRGIGRRPSCYKNPTSQAGDRHGGIHHQAARRGVGASGKPDNAIRQTPHERLSAIGLRPIGRASEFADEIHA